MINRDEEKLKQLINLEDDEEAFIKREIELYKLQEEMINHKDFGQIIQKVEELIAIYLPPILNGGSNSTANPLRDKKSEK